MIVYPVAGINSFISRADAILYFGTRLHSSKFTGADATAQDAALMTAFRSINELDLIIDPTVAAQIQALKDAQCEQALYEMREDLDYQDVKSFFMQGTRTEKRELPRHSPRALAILRPYISAPVLQVVR